MFVGQLNDIVAVRWYAFPAARLDHDRTVGAIRLLKA